jgi:hypothetical protein
MILLQLVALLLEFAGAVLMANGYLSPAGSFLDKLATLLSALFGGSTGRGAERAFQAGLSREQYRSVLRGLALIGVGFLLQAVALLMTLLGAESAAPARPDTGGIIPPL